MAMGMQVNALLIFYLRQNMFDILHAYKHKPLLITKETLRNPFTANVLDFTWLTLCPMFLFMYSLIFIFILNIRMPGLDSADYVFFIFSGLVPFLAFSETFCIGTISKVL